jgi:hypothetical protein
VSSNDPWCFGRWQDCTQTPATQMQWCLSSGVFLWDFLTKVWQACLISAMCATCAAPLNLLDLIL